MERIYQDGAAVEVWREKRDEWVSGEVLGFEERDGAWKYFVQLSGYTAAQATDPAVWFTADQLRSAD